MNDRDDGSVGPPDYDYTVAVVCQHKGQGLLENKPEELVSVIAHRPEPEAPGVRRYGFLEWVELVGRPPRMQTYYGEAARLARSPVTHNVRDLVPGLSHGVRWRFCCPVCRRTVEAGGFRFERVLDRLRDHGVPRVTLYALDDIVRNLN